MDQANSKKKRRLGLLITLFINLLIVGYIAFREFGVGTSGQSIELGAIRPQYLLFGVSCFFVAAAMEYIKYRRLLMASEGKVDRRGALECALLGKYYDNITPLGAGGQPFQIHYLRKRGYSSGTSAAAPTMGFITQQLGFILIALCVLIFRSQKVAEASGALNVTAIVGIVFYAIWPFTLLFFVVLPRPFKAFVNWLVKLLSKLHFGRHYLIKDAEATSERWLANVDEAVKCLRIYSKRVPTLICLILASLIYHAAILSVPFFMLKGFGGRGDWWTVTSLVAEINASIAIVPTPGNAGAAEGSFYAVFQALEGGMLFWAMIAWRLVVYYGWLICGVIVLVRSAISARKNPPEPRKQNDQLRTMQFMDIYFPAIDGVIRTVDAYARHLNEQGAYACVVYPKGRENAPELPYDTFPSKSVSLPFYANAISFGFASRELKQVFKTNPPDVLHAHSPFFVGKLALRLGRKYHIPVFATFHSKYYDDALNVTHSRLLAGILRSLVVTFYIHADYVWACSLAAAQTLRSYGYNGEIFIMENGTESANVPADLEKVKQRAIGEFGLPQDKRLLLFVGQMIWQKGLRLVLDTVKLLNEQGGDYYLVLAGTGFNEEAVREYARDEGDEKYAKFVGKVTDTELLYGLYHACDLFFFPSLYDNAPLVVREAAIAGTPSLLSRDSNAAEVVRDGENGYIADPAPGSMAERIRQIYASGRLAEVGQNAKATIPEDWSTITRRVITAYRTRSAEGHKDRLPGIFD